MALVVTLHKLPLNEFARFADGRCSTFLGIDCWTRRIRLERKRFQLRERLKLWGDHQKCKDFSADVIKLELSLEIFPLDANEKDGAKNVVTPSREPGTRHDVTR